MSDPGGIREAGEYWRALYNLLPVFVVGVMVAMTTNLRKIYALPSWQRIIAELILAGMIGGVAAMAAVALLPLVWDGTNPSVEIAIAALAGSYGQKTFDLLTKRIIGHEPEN
jgi:hypothetical protein